jgi:hypothetical protein
MDNINHEQGFHSIRQSAIAPMQTRKRLPDPDACPAWKTETKNLSRFSINRIKEEFCVPLVLLKPASLS